MLRSRVLRCPCKNSVLVTARRNIMTGEISPTQKRPKNCQRRKYTLLIWIIRGNHHHHKPNRHPNIIVCTIYTSYIASYSVRTAIGDADSGLRTPVLGSYLIMVNYIHILGVSCFGGWVLGIPHTPAPGYWVLGIGWVL